MASVSVSREIEGDVVEVTDAMTDVEPFMRASGFDEVTVDGETVTLEKQVGPMRIELVLDVLDDPNAVLAYEQREGIFDAMTTTYTVVEADDEVRVDATTDFRLDVALVGSFLDATVIKRQRRAELNAQFDYLESRVAE